MKKIVISKASDFLVDEVLREIGQDNIIYADPDSIDSIVQKAIDEMETQVYEKVLGRINEELVANSAQVLDKWWEV